MNDLWSSSDHAALIFCLNSSEVFGIGSRQTRVLSSREHLSMNQTSSILDGAYRESSWSYKECWNPSSIEPYGRCKAWHGHPQNGRIRNHLLPRHHLPSKNIAISFLFHRHFNKSLDFPALHSSHAFYSYTGFARFHPGTTSLLEFGSYYPRTSRQIPAFSKMGFHLITSTSN